MPKSYHQKLKLLFIRQFLLEKSDSEHPVSVSQIIGFLNDMGISAERKSVYEDLHLLQEFGDDVIMVRGKQTGYYIGERTFELPELKLLVDSVQSSKFITEKKTISLISKIESLASRYDGQKLQRQVYVRGRVKTMNESVYYHVDTISDAIARNRKISFQYFEYTLQKERHLRHGGGRYVLSPLALIWDDENYYLLAWNSEESRIRHFRVDKMVDICELSEKREGIRQFEKTDMSQYTVRVFGMFSGEEQQVCIRFAAHLIGAVLDRFGKDCIVIPDGTDSFTVTVLVSVSPLFFGWVAGFGEEAEILSPSSVRNKMKAMIEKMEKRYR